MSQFSDLDKKRQYENFSSRQFKIAILGGPAVGKTSFLRRAAINEFTQNYKLTLVMQYYQYKFALPQYQKLYKCKIWDTAGEPEHRSLFKSYVQGSQGLFILVSVQNLIQKIQIQDDSFLKQVQKQIYPFVQLIEDGRNSKTPPIYHFLLSKIDLVPDQNRDKIFNKFRECVISLLKEWDNSIKNKQKTLKRDQSQSFCAYQCTKLFGYVSSKTQNSQQIKKIIRKMTEIAYLEIQDQNKLLCKVIQNEPQPLSLILGQKSQQIYQKYKQKMEVSKKSNAGSKKQAQNTKQSLQDKKKQNDRRIKLKSKDNKNNKKKQGKCC